MVALLVLQGGSFRRSSTRHSALKQSPITWLDIPVSFLPLLCSLHLFLVFGLEVSGDVRYYRRKGGAAVELNADVYQDGGASSLLCTNLVSQEEAVPFAAVRDRIAPSPTQRQPEGSPDCAGPADGRAGGRAERQAATCEAF